MTLRVLLLWFSVVLLAQAADYSGPIVITRGGTYRGNWQSNDPSIPAVLISTAEPVAIEHSRLRSRGPLIAQDYPWVSGVSLTVRDVYAEGLNPMRSGLSNGRFLALQEPRAVRVENCELNNTGGIYILGFRGKGLEGRSIAIARNRVRNIDGRISDGAGGYVAGSERGRGFQMRQFVQLDKVIGIASIDISWNEVINEPYRSRVEDNISIYLSSGTASSPIGIHDNYIQGAFAADPADRSYSGGGIMLGDDGSPADRSEPGYVHAYENQVVGSGNYGIAIAAGSNSVAEKNRVVSSGRLPDGRPFGSESLVGYYVWDYKPNVGKFENNIARDNFSAVARVNRTTGQLEASNYWLPDCKAGCSRNESSAVDGTTEEDEHRRWIEKVQRSGVAIGVRPKK